MIRCTDGGLVTGTPYAFPMDARVRQVRKQDIVPCNQLFCYQCRTPVKHMDGVKDAVALPAGIDRLYDDLNPDAWLELVEFSDEYRLYFCRCNWYATPGAKEAAYLDTANIDHWRCAGHPE